MTLELGQNVLLNVEEELRPDLEPAQILLLLTVTEELNVWEQAVKPENVTLKDVLVRNSNMKVARPEGYHFFTFR